MVWESVVAHKREASDAAIAEAAFVLAKGCINDLCDFDPARTAISSLLEQLRTSKLSADSLVSAAIQR